MEQTGGHPERDSKDENEYEAKNYISIQEYTGEGYHLYDANEKVLEIAEHNSDGIVDAVTQFFQNNFNVQAKVHNMVSAEDGVTVFVESVHEPYFHTYAIIPIDENQKKVKLDSIWSQKGDVERAIKGGLYVMAFEAEFTMLDQYLERVTDEFPVIGTPVEVINMVKANGYTTPYYFISPSGDVFKQLYKTFMDNPDMTKDDIRSIFKQNMPEAKHINIGIEFYMRGKDVPPEWEILDTIVVDVQKMRGIPRGVYSIYLNDNQIDKIRGIGKKDSSLGRTTLDKVMKK